ncbi:MAG: YifB family Mg chelatase-like AAA ATPase [Chlorobiota bacterium]|nr:MAG: YifB family Mg chelatase-like AAA ATPase [Chlorobiota bacterium]
MFSQILSASTFGVNAFIVQIETHVENQLYSFTVVGLPDNAVRESRERVSAAIKNSELQLPNKKYTVNLAPADIRKEGSAFDLPIALGILSATGQIPISSLNETIVLGELALDGALRSVRGSLAIALEAKFQNIKRIILPKGNAEEAALVDNLEVIAVESLKEAVDILNGINSPNYFKIDRAKLFSNKSEFNVDFSDVKGQENTKRAIEIAAAGGHNLIMVGPPGSGKTMIAKRLPTILPQMTFDEALETTKIYSVAGVLPKNVPILTKRPFRSPHHTISDAALVGGGMGIARPGEISLSHHGVLFLDELPEFARNVLEVMRQPLEDKVITISRTKLSLTFPCNFMLIASMNPCPCGNFGNPNSDCSCGNQQIQKYMSKISGPLLDRIDLHVEVAAVKYNDLTSKKTGEYSKDIRERVINARKLQEDRFLKDDNVFKNADMTSNNIKLFCELDSAGQELLKIAMSKLGLSARAYDKILKVSRTIADLSFEENIKTDHLAEAIQYRSLDRQFWNV